jgi:hypothetical protein
MRVKTPSVLERLLCRVAGKGIKTTLFEDQTERIGNKTIIVYDQDALGSRYHRCGLA